VVRPVNRTAQVLDSFSEDFHILEIDIMIAANLQPLVLELNDQPSLKKKNVVFNEFSQISLDGTPLDMDAAGAEGRAIDVDQQSPRNGSSHYLV
jgi:hypothetical protein